MKKIITLLAAVTLIFGFVGIAAAQELGPCFTCQAPGTIDRACDIAEQGSCQSTPFDYEDQAYHGNYCDVTKAPRRVLFPICDCEQIVAGDVVDISLEILVNGQEGDNGAYWAQDVSNGIGLETYSTTDAGCNDYVSESNRPFLGYPSAFQGPFRYLTAAGNTVGMGSPNTGGTVPCSDITNAERVVRIEPDIQAINGIDCVPHGYTVTADDDTFNKQYWAIDIPYIRFDQNIVQAGDVISVRICVANATIKPGQTNPLCTNVATGGVCDDAGCCCEFELGTLGCCDDGITSQLTYPYATPMNSASWWYGMVITNLTDKVVEAAVTVYEEDGDTATLTSADVPALSIAARSMAVFNNQQLMTAFGGDIGDVKSWFEVNTDGNVSGFMFIGNDPQGYAMGYLPK